MSDTLEAAPGSPDRCPVPHERASDASADRCPVPHSARWTDDGLAAATSTAGAHAAHSHLQTERAEAMARAVADQRAVDRGVDEINERFISLIGGKLGYGHPLSGRTGTLEFTW